MKIEMNMDVAGLITRFERMERPLVYAAVNTINGSAEDIQTAEKDALKREGFTIRKPEFTLREIAIIKPRASVGAGRLFAEVSIGRKKRSLLAEFEEGGLKEHQGRSVAIPVTGTEARPTYGTPQAFPPLVKKLKFRRPRRKKGGPKPGARTILQGPDGYFLVPGVGIRRRVGDEVHTVIVFKRDVRIQKRLDWRAIARTVGERSMKERMEIETIKVIGRRG